MTSNRGLLQQPAGTGLDPAVKATDVTEIRPNMVPAPDFTNFIPLTDHPLSVTLANTRQFHKTLIIQSLKHGPEAPVQSTLRKLALLTDEIDMLEAVIFHLKRCGEPEEGAPMINVVRDHARKRGEAEVLVNLLALKSSRATRQMKQLFEGI